MFHTMTFPPEVADKLLHFAGDKGVTAPELFAGAGVVEGVPLGYAQLCALYEAGARLTRDRDFGLHVGERTLPEMYGLLGYAAAHSTTFGDALERLVALQAVWTDAVGFELRRDTERVTLRYGERVGIPPRERRQESEQMMAAIRAFAQAGTSEDVQPLEVRFEHPAPDSINEHKRIFACPLVFGAPATEMIISRAAFANRMGRADLTLGALLQHQAETLLAARGAREPLLEAVRMRVREIVAAGLTPSLEQIAQGLALGPRTIQRRLRDRGVTWRSTCDNVRIGLAKEMLADPQLALAQIAFRVGFSQTSAFHRAFRRIEGVTPGYYRCHVLALQEKR